MHHRSAVAQVVLEGVRLPAEKRELVEYARSQLADERVLAALEEIEDREYRSIDEVGEQIANVQPAFEPPKPREPAVESNEVPGGSAYTDPSPDPGSIREAPEILPYEEQLVRKPAPVGEGVPKPGERDEKPGS